MMHEFDSVEIGEEFTFNGNVWRKRSTRTAEITWPKFSAGPWFWFSKRDVVNRVPFHKLGVL